MSPFFQILKILNTVILGYTLLLSARILLSWFSGPYQTANRAFRILLRVTEPYLAFFRKIRFLRTGRMDFSPILAILTLVILSNITRSLALQGSLTIGFILAIVLAALWSGISFLLLFFAILISIRFFSIVFSINSVSPFIRALDEILFPVVHFFNRTFFKKKIIHYRMSLAFCGLIFFTLFFAGDFLTGQAAHFLRGL